MSGSWQDMPDWLVYAVRWQHAAAMQDGAERAGEDAVDRLTDRILADDPSFARLVIARYVRSLVRAPKPRRRRKATERDLMLAECARLSAEGLSLRAIGEKKGISHTAVAKNLAEWQMRLPEMPEYLTRLAAPVETGSVNLPATGFTPEVSAPANVVTLRRPA